LDDSLPRNPITGIAGCCQRDEVAALHSITSSASANNAAGTVSPGILAVQALMINSNLVDTHPSGSQRSSLRLRVSNR
jgi:hypothetical protein